MQALRGEWFRAQRLAARLSRRWLCLAVVAVSTALSAPLSAAETNRLAGPLAISHQADVPTIIDLAQPLAWGSQLALEWRWSEPATSNPAGWLEWCLVTNDQRFFTSAVSTPLGRNEASGRITIPLQASAWSSAHGPLTSDALAGVSQLWLRIHGSDSGRLEAHLDLQTNAPVLSPTLRLLTDGLVDRGPWREWWFDLGPGVRDGAAVSLVTPSQTMIPAFFQQPGLMQGEHWRPRGQPRWVVRLRSDETIPAGTVIQVTTTADHWTSQALPAVTTVSQAIPLPSAPTTRPHPRGGSWSDRCIDLTEPAQPMLLRQQTRPSALAPLLVWRADWTGDRGADLVSHARASLLDRDLLQRPAAIDLLPQALFGDQGTFRFGLSPWAMANGGPWSAPETAWDSPDALAELSSHARRVVAMSRAVGSLSEWQLGALAPANSPGQLAVWQAWATDLATWIASHDQRPVYARHPQLAAWNKRDPTAWADFESGLDGWRAGPGSPLVTATTPSRRIDERSGNHALIAALPETGGASLMRLVDADVFGLERLEFSAQLPGQAGGSLLVAWATDNHHRWYQQTIGWLPAGRPWRTMAIDFADQAEWQPVAHATPWDGSQRRRIRRLGIIAWPHQLQATTRELRLDNMIRFGEPSEPSDASTLRITTVAGPNQAVAAHAVWETQFDLSLQARNPYDPRHADVRIELSGPGGETRQFPAYWHEPHTIAREGDHERVRANGLGQWRTRVAVDVPGTWRFRIIARIKWRDDWREATGDWQAVQVTAADPERLPRIRQASNDPRYWETEHGDFFYPLGINLRSPGDERQDPLLNRMDVDWRSEDLEADGTAAYVRWFATMQQHQMNYARVWMSPWWMGLEWHRSWDDFGGLMVYNQANAARMDRIVELAAAHRIYLQVELQNHGMTSQNVDEQWDPEPETREPGSPYNAVNGGPCRRAFDYFTNEEAWHAHQARLRYTVARWGAYQHIMAWVLSSELEFTGAWWQEAFNRGERGHSPTTTAWVERNLAWFTDNDHHQRPVSVHFSHPWRAGQFWRDTAGLGFNNSNAYTGFQSEMGQLGGRRAGLGSAMMRYLSDHFPPWDLERPTMIGEWGGHWSERSPQVLEAELRVGTWLQAVLPYGGNVGFWWWLYLDAGDEWDRYAVIARFLNGDDPRGTNLRPVRFDVDGGPVFAAGSSGPDRHRIYAWQRGIDKTPWNGRTVHTGQLQITGNEPGSRWRVEVYSPEDGSLLATTGARANDNGVIRYQLGAVAPDLAIKLDRVDSSR